MKASLNILLTADRISHATNSALKPFGISKEQFNDLRILRGQSPNPASLQLVCERMISKSSNATRLVEKLRQKGLVDRHQCDTDRRQIDIRITDKGMQLLKQMDPMVKKSGEQMRKLNEKESKELNRLLDKMRG